MHGENHGFYNPISMHIAIFSDNFYPELGGIQDSILTLSRSLALRGHRVTLCVPSFSRRDCEIAKLPYRELHLGPRIEIRRFASFHFPSSTRQSRCVVPAFRRWRALKPYGIDLIHTQTFFGVGLEALSAAKHLGVPLIGTNHTEPSAFDDYVPIGKQVFRSLSMKAVNTYYNKCNVVLAPSETLRADMMAHGLTVPSDVLSNPIDTELFSPGGGRAALKKKFGLGAQSMVFAGRLGIEKNIDVLIRAFALLSPKHPELTLAIAGHGSHQRALRALGKKLGIDQGMLFLGTLSSPDLAGLMQASDIFCIASTSETQSMTVLQAMSTGIPAIGVDMQALPEYIKHERHGLIVPPGNPEAFAKAAEELLNDDSKRLAFGENASRWVRSNFSISAVTDKAERIYADAVRTATRSSSART